MRCRARGPCEPPPFASLALLARAGVPGAGGISAECLVFFKMCFLKSAGFSNSRAHFVCDFSVRVIDFMIGRLGLPTARENEFSKTNQRFCRQKVNWGSNENTHTSPRAGKLVTAATQRCHWAINGPWLHATFVRPPLLSGGLDLNSRNIRGRGHLPATCHERA